jgi:hypothetical protein
MYYEYDEPYFTSLQSSGPHFPSLAGLLSADHLAIDADDFLCQKSGPLNGNSADRNFIPLLQVNRSECVHMEIFQFGRIPTNMIIEL